MAENYSRRLNIRLLGLVEDEETSQPVKFFESWLPQFLQIPGQYNGRIKLERAHRVVAPRPGQNKPPQPLLLRFLVFNGSRLSFYNNFSSSVTRKRKAFDVVKRQLQERGISYGILYPTILDCHIMVQRRDTPPQRRSAIF